MVYWLNTGVPWRDCLKDLDPWQSVYSRFRAWTKAGVWEDVLTNLIQQDIVDKTTLMLDSTSIKVHQHASSSKKGAMNPQGASGAVTPGRDKGSSETAPSGPGRGLPRSIRIRVVSVRSSVTQPPIWWVPR